MGTKLLELIVSKIKIIKLAKILRINPKFFLDVVLFHLSKLFSAKIEDILIIFGSVGGKAFIGNPKYIYCYLKKYQQDPAIFFVLALGG